MKTRKAQTAAMLAAFVLSITPAVFAQSGTTSGSAPAPPAGGATATTTTAPAKPTHKECAIACAKAGQVLGILETKTQKLYMVATDKPGEDPNKGLIDYVGQMVLVKGRVYSRGGATGIKITSVEPYSPTAAIAQ
ncbi:MAG: hypothetical protein E6K71_10125 [Candidatus Eisenbacteria bacterium]|uniref:DUF5666 domain-containing protein n=1 Tax=Eiseniibacteriota bacterium TaxID=2212470 RepID=A0A538S7M4_UNCEI|nr:MAG: hypothetical protein E6K71_10125 [Candidatus Eisenbacteria bacterium]